MDFDDRFNTESAGHLDLLTVTAGLLLAGRYRLDSLLAFSHGVMTWRAVDQILSRPVLVHLLEPEDERLGWVLEAARRAATVIDSRFLRVLDAQEASGQEPWSLEVCEYAVGDSLKTLLAAGPLTTQQAGFIVHEVAVALAPLHARGLFHLRINPDSVIITANGNVKIVGLLIDAALRPQPGEDQLSWSDQEAIDVNALGQLLYASMTGNWPVPPSLPQRPNWGLPAAPMRGLPPAEGEPDQQVWPAPHELNRQINPEASAVTMAVLRPALGQVGPSLRSADDIADSLESVIAMPAGHGTPHQTGAGTAQQVTRRTEAAAPKGHRLCRDQCLFSHLPRSGRSERSSHPRLAPTARPSSCPRRWTAAPAGRPPCRRR